MCATTGRNVWSPPPHPPHLSPRCSEALMAISLLVAGYDNLLLDLDGVVWIGDRPTRRAADAISELRAAGKHVAFVTNDPRLSPEEYARKLWSLCIQASLE